MEHTYETNNVVELIKKRISNGNYDKKEVKLDGKFYRTAPEPSELLKWHLQESDKRKQKLENHIDINMVRAAIKGYRNEWYFVMMKNKEKFITLFDQDKINWEELMEFKKNGN